MKRRQFIFNLTKLSSFLYLSAGSQKVFAGLEDDMLESLQHRLDSERLRIKKEITFNSLESKEKITGFDQNYGYQYAFVAMDCPHCWSFISKHDQQIRTLIGLGRFTVYPVGPVYQTFGSVRPHVVTNFICSALVKYKSYSITPYDMLYKIMYSIHEEKFLPSTYDEIKAVLGIPENKPVEFQSILGDGGEEFFKVAANDFLGAGFSNVPAYVVYKPKIKVEFKGSEETFNTLTSKLFLKAFKEV